MPKIRFNDQISDEVREFLKGVQGCVEANSFEYSALWAYNQRERPSRDWEEIPMGFGVFAGSIGKRHVMISLRMAKVSGVKILFWYACSQVVDHAMIDKWLGCFVTVKKTDAANFHTMFS